MPSYYSDREYEGPEAVVVAMDIGTTQSAVSFAHFIPGTHPEAQTVAHWPGQPYWAGAKTPSIVSYKDGVVKACGAEALRDLEERQENVACRFKLHLYPDAVPVSNSNPPGPEPPFLPVHVTIERVYADIMKYLMDHTQDFFERTTREGAKTWARLHHSIVILLAIPNGWDIREQGILRKAAVMASLVTEENAGQLVQFVTEAEASAHYVLAYRPAEWLRQEIVFGVIDCGGCTANTTIYRCTSTGPLSLTETCPSECIQAGGMFVDQEVEKMLRRKLKGSVFDDAAIIRSMVDAFEKELKPSFNGALEQYELKFGVNAENDSILGIYKGRITLSNQELRELFDPVIAKIVTNCLTTLIGQKTEYVLLVGGFAESPYVQKVLSARLGSHYIHTITAGDYLKKAASEGAIIRHIKRSFIYIVRATLGGCVRQIYNKRMHHERKGAVQRCADGKERVDGVFKVWIKEGNVLPSAFATRSSYHAVWDATYMSQSDLRFKLGTIEIEVFAWEGSAAPIWCMDIHGTVLPGMRSIGTLNADLSSLAVGLPIRNGPHGKRFYRVDYDVYIYLEKTQLRAKLQWKERGVLREGLVKVMHCVS